MHQEGLDLLSWGISFHSDNIWGLLGLFIPITSSRNKRWQIMFLYVTGALPLPPELSPFQHLHLHKPSKISHKPLKILIDAVRTGGRFPTTWEPPKISHKPPKISIDVLRTGGRFPTLWELVMTAYGSIVIGPFFFYYHDRVLLSSQRFVRFPLLLLISLCSHQLISQLTA